MNQTIDQTLRKAVAVHRSGNVQEAERLYTAILKVRPMHPDANHNMGVLAVGLGKIKESIPFFQEALKANPNISQFWLSYIDTLIKLNKIDDAKVIFNQATKKGFEGPAFYKLAQQLDSMEVAKKLVSKYQDPPPDKLQIVIDLYKKRKFQKLLNLTSKLLQQFPSSIILHNISGVANQGLGQFNAAIESFNKALFIKPDFAEAYNNLGNAFKEQGKLEDAIKAYNQALTIKPDNADTLNNKGVALQEQNKLDDAIEAYNQALIIKPSNASTFNNMGVALQEKGKLEEAIESYNQALTIEPNYPSAHSNLGAALKGFTFKKPSPNMHKAITLLLDNKSYVRPNTIATTVINLLKFEPDLHKYLHAHYFNNEVPNIQDIIINLSRLPLLLKLMSVCPLPDLGLEHLFREIRANLLSSISSLISSPTSLRFQSALALQCFTNEYIYHQREHEERELAVLEKKVKQVLTSGKQPDPRYILCLASYKALNQYEWCDLLNPNADIDDVFVRQFTEPNQEKNLRSKIPILDKITNNISSKVRNQYESSPYPRWVDLGLRLEPASISELVNELNLKIFQPTILDIKFPNILVAGCGTGQHPIETSARFKGSRVLAIDLSLSSLVYARRKTEELGIKNIDYMQADILDLAQLNKQFDIIESAGVLHHMDDPIAGWQVLTDCLKPSGLMKIGLYSELGRQHIVEMREEIKKLDIGSTNLEMKLFRHMVMHSNKKHHKQITSFDDFYSLSEFKDLLFHVQESRFSIPQISSCLKELGLKFCGFESNNIVKNFKSINPGTNDAYNLDKWAQYEEAYPQAFRAMFQFWCQKVAKS